MRAIWSGSISFGLVNIPVKLYSASETRDGIDLHMLHKSDKSPIRYARICVEEEKEVPFVDIVKGYEYSDDHYVIITDEDFKAADPKKTSSVEIVEFVKEDEIDIRYLERPFYLEPEKGADKAYVLLREALNKAGKLAVCRFVLREREHLGVLKPVGKVIVLNQMRFPADLKTTGGLKIPGETAGAGELKMALNLIDQLSGPFIAEDYHDTYTEELEKRIKAKIKNKPIPKTKSEKEAPVKDLMAALKASLK